jgi:hypothetical protein
VLLADSGPSSLVVHTILTNSQILIVGAFGHDAAHAEWFHVCPVPPAAMSRAASGGRTVESVTEEDF